MISIFLKGMVMGIADIVPGISGGTVALILGIYDDLIFAISSISIKSLTRFEFKKFCKSINFKLILPLGFGILSSVFIFGQIVDKLLTNYPVYLWSLFLGLILSSILILIHRYESLNRKYFSFFMIGLALALVSFLPGNGIELPSSLLFVFIAGIIASLAMILPGISGSYILVLLGLYSKIISSIKALDFQTLVIFGSGVALGIIFGSKFISKLIEKSPHKIYALLFGMVIGSLQVIWPWKDLTGSKIIPGINSFSNIISILIVTVAFSAVIFIEKVYSKSR
jgi:putative membrane protein